jgi:hypothetical protein
METLRKGTKNLSQNSDNLNPRPDIHMKDADDSVATFGKPWDRGFEPCSADGCRLCPRFSVLQLTGVEPSLRVLPDV